MRVQGVRWRTWWKRMGHEKLPTACPVSFPGPPWSGPTTFLSPSLLSHCPLPLNPALATLVSLLFCGHTSIPTSALALLSAQHALLPGTRKAFFLTSLRPLPHMSSSKQRHFLWQAYQIACHSGPLPYCSLSSNPALIFFCFFAVSHAYYLLEWELHEDRDIAFSLFNQIKSTK